MANKKYYYVGVHTKSGLMLVTERINSARTCYWSIEKKPLSMAKSVAEDTALGLCLNGFVAVVVQSIYELTGHFIATAKIPKKREEYTEADLKLLGAYEYLMDFDDLYVYFIDKYDTYCVSNAMRENFDEEAFQKRFLEALDALNLSYSDWDKSRIASKEYWDLVTMIKEALTDKQNNN